ncbi:MAG: murein L,D-transpeptidase catalytic domain-containing protein [Pseudobdellovibrio sp.]
MKTVLKKSALILIFFSVLSLLDTGCVSLHPLYDPTPLSTERTEKLQRKYPELCAAFHDSEEFQPLLQALDFLEMHSRRISNQDYLTLINYKKNANTPRFFVINLQTNEVEKYVTANGKNSDPEHDGFAKSFSNEADSLQSSLGFFLTLDDYYSDKFESKALRLEGLSSTNSNAYDRAIVVHGASYVDSKKEIYGRSYGCPALEKDVVEPVINKIKNGSLIFAFY